MPQNTFFNLDEEKQKRIMAAAIGEFSAKGYRGANIQDVADKAGVAKGSMYQYFHNKKELFFYTIDLAAMQKIELMKEFMADQPNMAFFDLMESLFSIGIRFAADNPALFKIYQDIQQGVPVEIRKEFEERMGAMGQHHYQLLLKQAMMKGELRRDVGEDLAAFVVYTLLKNFGNFILDKGGLRSPQVQQQYVSQFVDILKNGIKA